jgi:FkbM family methyltransferase
MLTKAVRLVYAQRAWLKRLLPIRRPVLLNLKQFKIYVRLDDWAIGARIAVKRSYEAHVTTVMWPCLKPGMTVLDIGANIGYYTLLMASRVGPAGKVIAFEPSRRNCDLLEMSLAINQFRNVAVHACAVADIDGFVGFDMDDSNGGITQGNPAESMYQVPAALLDTLLRIEPRIDLIKIDIEGAEGRALRGMESLLRLHRPIIFTEFSPAALQAISGVAPRQYLDMLWALEYGLFVIGRNQSRAPEPQTYEEIMQQFTHTASDHLDLVAYPKSRPAASAGRA